MRGNEGAIEMRVSTFPTIFGERAVIRMFAAADELLEVDQLGLPADVNSQLGSLLHETTGALLITGPAGSGKTTTAYACLRELVLRSGGGRSIVSLEDPVEVVLSGVSQSQVNPAADFDLHTGLKSMLRQDPEVIFVGEIRDRVTAEIAFQAALTGQLVVSTFHAGSAAEAISRLADMGIEPYLLRSALLGILSQRLVRTVCECFAKTSDKNDFLGLPVATAARAGGCGKCGMTGYAGRSVLAEMLLTRHDNIGQAILDQKESPWIEKLATEGGMVTLRRRSVTAVEEYRTTPQEIRRVFGLGVSFEEASE